MCPSHADADVRLFTRIRRYSMPAAPLARSTDTLKRHTSPFRGGFRFVRRRPSRDNFNPHFRTFFHNLTASAANTSGFLQVSLSKILGNAHGSPRPLVS